MSGGTRAPGTPEGERLRSSRSLPEPWVGLRRAGRPEPEVAVSAVGDPKCVPAVARALTPKLWVIAGRELLWLRTLRSRDAYPARSPLSIWRDSLGQSGLGV